MKTLVLTGLALSLAVVGAGGWAAWNSTASAHQNPREGTLQIEVVAPREPELPQRAILAVGALRDGYVHDADRLQPPAILDAEYGAYVEAAWTEPEPLAEPMERDDRLVWTSLRPVAPPRLEPDDYSFGFDQPLPETRLDDARNLADGGAWTPPATAAAAGWDESGLD